jgi:Zinc finger, C3HC4 type (RING finger)
MSTKNESELPGVSGGDASPPVQEAVPALQQVGKLEVQAPICTIEIVFGFQQEQDGVKEQEFAELPEGQPLPDVIDVVDDDDYVYSAHHFVDIPLPDFTPNVQQIETAVPRRRKCWECGEKYATFAIIGCGHRIVCGSCVQTFLRKWRKCPICNYLGLLNSKGDMYLQVIL